jgi:hypothetical protein
MFLDRRRAGGTERVIETKTRKEAKGFCFLLVMASCKDRSDGLVEFLSCRIL